MSYFGNSIREFPDIAVDRFNVDAKAYFLTHCHSDHLVGAKNRNFQGLVYCSHLTKQLLTSDERYSSIVPYLQGVSYNTPFFIRANGDNVRVVLIASYHCPGSAMILLEGSRTSVLFSGDIRAESWWTLGLKKNPYLFPYTVGTRVLDNIYLDTTFAYRGEPYIEMLSNAEGISTAIEILRLYPSDDPDIQVLFADHTLGFEEAWAQIVSSLHGNFHVLEYLERRNKVVCLGEYVVPYHPGLCDLKIHDDERLNFHACNKICSQNHKFDIRVKQCINFNILDFVGFCMPVKLESLGERSENVEKIDVTSKGYEIVQFEGRRWLKVGCMLLPDKVKLVFSRHSSYCELKEFVKVFKPVQVYPCVVPKGAVENGFTMRRLFGMVCQLETVENFTFDILQKASGIAPSKEILNRPVKTINRWNVNECENELRFVSRIIDLPGNKFLGINYDEFNPPTDKGPTIIDLMGQGNDQFKKLVDQSIYLYTKYLQHKFPGSRPGNTNHIDNINRCEQEMLQHGSYSFLSIEDMDYYTRESMSDTQNSTEEFRCHKSTLDTMHVVMGEYGPAVRIPTIRDQAEITSSFDSIEISCAQHNSSEVDSATIERICHRLCSNLEEYFEMQLKCLA